LSFYKKYLIFSTILGLVMMISSFHNEAVQEPAATEIQKELRVELNKKNRAAARSFYCSWISEILYS